MNRFKISFKPIIKNSVFYIKEILSVGAGSTVKTLKF
jgi:hypothetical protein